MKWFKHISDSLDDPFIFELIDQFGGDGYLVFFGTLEIISREFDVKSPGKCTIPERFLIKKLQVSRQKVVKVLNFCNKKGRILAKFNKGKIQLYCPKLKELCDDWTKKLLRSESEVTSKKLPIEVRSKKEEVRSKNIKKNIKKKVIGIPEKEWYRQHG